MFDIVEYEQTLEKIINKSECACPGIEFGAKHSKACPKVIAKEQLDRIHQWRAKPA